MSSNRTTTTIAFVAVVAAGLAAMLSTVACAGPDTGTITFGTGESAASETPKGNGTSTDTNKNDPAPAGGAVNATFKNETYNAISQCGSCHNPGTNGAPIFFGTDAASTYPLLKAKGYHLANSKFMTKGAHTGPALTPEQTTAMNNWIASEGGGAAPAGDGGP